MTLTREPFASKKSKATTSFEYSPIIVHTGSIHRASELSAFDCLRIIIIRDGSAFLRGDFGEEIASVGDIVIFGSNVRCKTVPEGHLTSTVIFIDPDYIVDQVFWQYAHVLNDHLDAKEFFAMLYSEPAQVLKVGEEKVDLLMPWLDEMTALSARGSICEHFLRMQALWFLVADAITPTHPGLDSASERCAARADPPDPTPGSQLHAHTRRGPHRPRRIEGGPRSRLEAAGDGRHGASLD